MAAYIVATTVIHNADAFGAYLKGIAGLSERFGGEAIIRGPVREVLEGQAPAGERVVISRYPSEDMARAYLASPEYIAAKTLRQGAADVTIRLLVD